MSLHTTVEITTENAAFFDNGGEDFNPAPEVARILRELADKVDREAADDGTGIWSAILRDVNGNMVGRIDMDVAVPEGEQ